MMIQLQPTKLFGDNHPKKPHLLQVLIHVGGDFFLLKDFMISNDFCTMAFNAFPQVFFFFSKHGQGKLISESTRLDPLSSEISTLN